MDKIFTPIKERVLKYLEEQGISKQAFYSTTGLAASNFKGQGARSELGGQAIAKILSEYKTLDAEWLLTGVGDMLRSAASAVPAPAGKGLPLIPMSAVAGKGTFSYSDLKIEDYYYVADLKQADFLCRVNGDSMYPKYNGGDIVACMIVKDPAYWEWHRVHVLYTESHGMLIKRVEPSEKPDNIQLVSENTSYKAFDIPLADIRSVALVIGAICLE